MKVRRESVQAQRETGTWIREALRHTHAGCRKADLPQEARLHVC